MTPLSPYRARTLGFDPAITPLFGRAPIMVPMEQDTLAIRFVPPPQPDDTWLTLSFSFGNWSGICSIAHGIMRMLLRMAEPRPRAPLTSPVAGLLLEMLFDAPLASLEGRIGSTFALTGFATGPPQDANLTRIGFRAAFGAEESFDGLLLVPSALLRAMIAQSPPLVRSLASPPIAICFRIGALAVTPTELQSLRPGAGLVIGRVRPDRLVVVAGEYLAAMTHYDGYSAVCATSLHPAHEAGFANWIGMSTDSLRAPLATDTRLGALNVPLSFEIGRRVMTLAELSSIGEGHVLEIGPLSDQTVSVIANGQRIAEGELVEIGTTLAVRLIRVVGG